MTERTTTSLTAIPRGVWVLGFVSMLMDISSEMIHSLLPLFLVTGLGSSVFAVGLLEGLAESTALVVKVFSGALSDYLGRRKGIAVVGYGLGAISKPLFAMATTFGLVVTARLLDRVGKGIRGAPRDAFTSPRTGCSHTITTFLEQYYYSSRPGQHGSQVAFLDLASRDHENHGFGNAGAEIKAWLLGHAAILALGFSTCLVISATLAIRLQHPHAGYAAFFDQTPS